MIILLLALFSCYQLCHGVYTPGTPGAAWSEEEMLAVKQKLHMIMMAPATAIKQVPEGPVSFLDGKLFSGEEIYHRMDNVIDEGVHLQDAVLPNLPKLIRLAFHDCIIDSETGGCNGCLNFANMGKENPGVEHQGCTFKGTCENDSLPPETDNNNLLWVARVLEMIYEDENLRVPNFKRRGTPSRYIPLGGKQIVGSLKQNGKSRADLWAFAGLVAVELGAQAHNRLCDEADMTNFCRGQPENAGPCSYNIPKMEFKHGRKDCIPDCDGSDAFYGFCSKASETHPDPQGNGKSVTTFFKDQFGLTARESVALMGAHNFGHTNEQISGFRHYPWVRGFRTKALNNEYYKYIVEPKAWRRMLEKSITQVNNKCNRELPFFAGDEYGNARKMYWVVRSQWQNNDGGPWNWSAFQGRCDQRICDAIKGDLHPYSCCRHKCDPSKGMSATSCLNAWCDLETDKFNCTMPTFIRASMMNVDMGLYLDFDIESGGESKGQGHGRPKGCPGLNRPSWVDTRTRKRAGTVYTNEKLPVFTEEHYLEYSDEETIGSKDIASNRYSDVVPGKRFSGCMLNKDLTEDGQPMHEVVEEFALDNQKFVNEFVDVFQKMIANGYQAANPKNNEVLQTHDWEWVKLRCKSTDCWVEQ